MDSHYKNKLNMERNREEILIRNLTDAELLRFVDRTFPSVRVLAERLEKSQIRFLEYSRDIQTGVIALFETDVNQCDRLMNYFLDFDKSRFNV